MKNLCTPNRTLRFLAILAISAGLAACGDENTAYDDDLAIESHALSSDEARALHRNIHSIEHVGDIDDGEHEIDEASLAERYDLTQFDFEKHRTHYDEDIQARLNLDDIERFEFDCGDSGENCGPNQGARRDLSSAQLNLEGTDADEELETELMDSELEFDPQRHRVDISTEIENRLNLDRIRRFGLDCNDATHDCSPVEEAVSGKGHIGNVG